MSQIIGVKIKREILVGAAKTTILETEELATRTSEEVSKLTEKLFNNGARHARASELLSIAESTKDDEIQISLESFKAIHDHIPER